MQGKKSIKSKIHTYVTLKIGLAELRAPETEALAGLCWGGHPGFVTAFEGGLRVKNVDPISLEEWANGLNGVEWQRWQGTQLLFGECDEFTDDMVCIAEWQAFEHEVIDNIGSEEHGIADGLGAGFGAQMHACDGALHDAEAIQRGVQSVENGGLILLEIAVIGEREAFSEEHQGIEGRANTRGLAANQLQRIGILLLRHEARAGGVGVGQADEIELAAAPQDKILSHAGQMEGDLCAGVCEFDKGIAVGDGVHGVLGECWGAIRVDKAEGRGGEGAIEGQGGAGDGT